MERCKKKNNRIMERLFKRKKELGNFNADNKGFTLIEMVIVLVIIAILAAMIAPRATQYIKTANTSTYQSTAKNIETAAASYLAQLRATNQTVASAKIVMTAGSDGSLTASGTLPTGWNMDDFENYFSKDFTSGDKIGVETDEYGAVNSVYYCPDGSGTYYVPNSAPVETAPFS